MEKKRKGKSEERVGYILVFPAMTLIVLFFAVPFLFSFFPIPVFGYPLQHKVPCSQGACIMGCPLGVVYFSSIL